MIELHSSFFKGYKKPQVLALINLLGSGIISDELYLILNQNDNLEILNRQEFIDFVQVYDVSDVSLYENKKYYYNDYRIKLPAKLPRKRLISGEGIRIISPEILLNGAISRLPAQTVKNIDFAIRKCFKKVPLPDSMISFP